MTTRKLASPNDPIGAEVRAALHSAFGSVPGVRVSGVNAIAEGDHVRGVSVFLTGWSPSLHELHINYVATVPIDLHRTLDAETTLRSFAPALTEQRGRARNALSLGRALPLPYDSDPVVGGPSDTPHVSHLLVDRALPVLAALDGDHLEISLVEGVMDLHRDPQDSNGGPLLADSTTFVAAADAGMVAGRLVPIDTVPGTPATFDGRWLRIGGGALAAVPETVITMLPGRRVRDVVPLHPSLDDRIILEACEDERDGDLALLLEPDLVPFGEIEAIGAPWHLRDEAA
jgi:hypothetical protein